MTEETFLAIGCDIDWAFRRLKWWNALVFALLALILTEGW